MSDDGIELRVRAWANVVQPCATAVISMEPEVDGMMRELFAAVAGDLTEAEERELWNAMDDTTALAFERAARRAIELGASLLTPEDRALQADTERRGGQG